jgi:hypothetical protein
MDNNEGRMDLMLELEHPSSEPIASLKNTMDINPPCPEDIYQIPKLSLVNLEGGLTHFNGKTNRGIAVLGMLHHMDENFVYHALCLCHKDGSGDNSPMRRVGNPEHVVAG